MTRKNPPLLRRSGLTGAVYVITRYTRRGDVVDAQEKFDVTDQFNALVKEQLEEAIADKGYGVVTVPSDNPSGDA